MNSCSFSCIFGDWLEACSLKALPIMEWRTVVNWLTEVRITLLFVAALPLLEELRRFQSRGKTWREIDWGFLLYNTGTIPKGKTNQNKSAWQKKKTKLFYRCKGWRESGLKYFLIRYYDKSLHLKQTVQNVLKKWRQSCLWCQISNAERWTASVL